MNQDSVIDKMVKIPLLTDMMNLIGVQPCKRSKEDLEGLSKGWPLPGVRIESKSALTAEQANSWDQLSFGSILDADNLSVLFDTDEEGSRLGNFTRVLPDSNKPLEYLLMTEKPKPNNYLVRRFLELQNKGINILDLISQKALPKYK